MTTASDVGGYFLSALGPLDTWKLQKLVYYAQAWHLAIFDAPIFDQPIEAWRDGPVVDALYQQHRRMRTLDSIRCQPLPAGNVENVCRAVKNAYGDLSGDDLSKLTHGERPWRETRGSLEPSARSRAHISHDLIKEHYRSHDAFIGRTVADLAAGGLHVATDRWDDSEMADEHLRLMRESLRVPGPEPAQNDTPTAVRADVIRRLPRRRHERVPTALEPIRG